MTTLNPDLSRFSAACDGEELIFGAPRPRYRNEAPIGTDVVEDWIKFMKAVGIQRVCCLLDEEQLGDYQTDLLGAYSEVFGEENVCSAPIPDFTLADRNKLYQKILPFLQESNQLEKKTVVHCSFGSGRTGHVLAAWLVSERGYQPLDALRAVEQMDRIPDEVVGYDGYTLADLVTLITPEPRDD